MSLFGKWFGRESAAEIEAKAEASASDHHYGTAKLAFERALDRAEDTATKERLVARIRAMRDAIARGRIVEAGRLLEAGSSSDALRELDGATEVAVDPAIVAEADALRERIRLADTMQGTNAPRARSRAELVDAVTSGWNDAQAEEFEALGEPLLDALVAMESGRFADARSRLEGLIAETPASGWLHRELARARWADGDAAGADTAFLAFFEAVTDDDFDRELFETRLDRARLLDELGRDEDAILEIERSLDHVGDSPRAFVSAARFLREHGHAEDAKGVLDACLDLDGATSDRMVQIEYALVEATLGRSEEALVRLERIALDERQRGYEPPRDLEGTRAVLLAKVGRKEHAAELFRRLALAATDVVAFEHAIAAAGLHAELGHRDEAIRLLDRAQRISPDEAHTLELTRIRGRLLDGDGAEPGPST